MTHVSKVSWHNILGDTLAFNNIQHNYCIKHTLFLQDFGNCKFWKLHENGVFLLHSLQTIWKLCKNEISFGVVFIGCRGLRRVFPESDSRTKSLCDPEQPQALGACRGLSIEREHWLKVCDIHQILGSMGQSHPKQQELAFVSDSGGTRAEVKSWPSSSGPASVLPLSATIEGGLVAGQAQNW